MSLFDWLSPQKRQTRELVAIIDGLARGDASQPIAAKGQGALAPVFSALRSLQSSQQKANQQNADYRGQIEAINKSQGVIEFNLDGTVISANANFLAVIGYSLEEIRGKHHRAFVGETYAASPEYRLFWDKLKRGEAAAGEYQRIAKGGREVWIEASYNPIRDADGKPYKVVKFASDITQKKLQNADYQGQIEAIGKSQGVIEFKLDGTVITANANFLAVIGYSLDEVKGRHHRSFVDPAYANSHEYQAFWDKLRRGQYDAGEYKRIAKGGREVWIEASYNPIRDANGKPYKVVKYATDITRKKRESADFQGQIEAINKSQGVIQFHLDGTVIEANANFLAVIGYSLEEIRGKHHRSFVDTAYANSAEYRAFWDKLNRGEYDAGEYRRIGKGGREVWIQASYNPIRDANGRPYKVVKYAADITQQKRYQLAVELAMKETKAVMSALASGDLTQSMHGQYEGEFAELRNAVNQSIDNLRHIVQGISQASDLINTASREIAMGNSDLSQRTEEQASSLEETASSIEELSSTVKQNADNARQASQMAVAASEVAAKGGSVVHQVVATMNDINDSARKIVDIISVIDGIAFQTNILALNAAVEAARAGEQGRGFAVVASEVRNLAQRSAAAAKEIKTLISDSVDKVETGSNLVSQAGSTMEEIVTSVKRVTDIMAEISSASAEQSSGIEQINGAITQIDEVTQQNAALVEQAAAAAQSLTEQAQTLSESVSRFRLSSQGKGGLPAQAARALPAPAKAGLPRPAAGRAQAKPLPKARPQDDDWAEF